MFSYLEDTILSNWAGQFEAWKAMSGACTHLMLFFFFVHNHFPKLRVNLYAAPCCFMGGSCSTNISTGAEEGNKDLTSSKCPSVPTHCHSSLTGMLQNQKDMDKHLILLSCFCSWTKTLIRYTSQMNSKKHKVSIPQTSLRVLLLFQGELGLLLSD